MLCTMIKLMSYGLPLYLTWEYSMYSLMLLVFISATHNANGNGRAGRQAGRRRVSGTAWCFQA